MIHQLVLVRHAKSDYPIGVLDLDRPLSPRGRREAPLVGRWLADHGVAADLVLVSSATRTQETWSLVNAHWTSVTEVRQEPRIYEATEHELTELIAETDETVETVVIVGHNPGLQDLVLTLADADSDVSPVRTKFPTSAIAMLRIPGEWAHLRSGSATLSAFSVPRP